LRRGALVTRVALATCAEVADLEPDDRLLIAPLAERGVEAVAAVWDDSAVEWEAFDLVVLRSTWDYAERREAFLDWTRSLPRVVNPVPVVEWNTDKRLYLSDLEAASVSIVPTSFVPPDGRFAPPDEPFVVKPTVSAGGRSSARFDPDEANAARTLVASIHAGARTAMIQPYVSGVEERALVYIDGQYSHALCRSAPLPPSGARAVLYLDERLGAATATPEERRTAEAALACAPGDLLYARVDLLGAAVLELELAEPSLYFSFGEGSADRFADAVAAAASQRRRMSAEKGPTTSQ
jgi:glutathione synthase/RimK-type ligase-like ATP-grasp enzyme